MYLNQCNINIGMFNPFPHKPLFLHVCSTSLLKTLREKEKLLITSNFSLSHSVFHSFAELSPIFINFDMVSPIGHYLKYNFVFFFVKSYPFAKWSEVFTNPRKKSFWKHCGKRRKCWWPAFSPFSTMFFYHFKDKNHILSNSIALNFDKSNILSIGKEFWKSTAIH